MNSIDLIPISKIYKELRSNYMKVLENQKLDYFCRILAIMVFDHKKMQFKQIFKYKENLKIKPSLKITTENQNICFHLPDFLEKLITTLK
jgi:hypothetical protein